MALTETLEQIIQEYRREHDQGKKLIITKDNTPKQIRNTREDTGTIKIEFDYLYQTILRSLLLITVRITLLLRRFCI